MILPIDATGSISGPDSFSIPSYRRIMMMMIVAVWKNGWPDLAGHRTEHSLSGRVLLLSRCFKGEVTWDQNYQRRRSISNEMAREIDVRLAHSVCWSWTHSIDYCSSSRWCSFAFVRGASCFQRNRNQVPFAWRVLSHFYSIYGKGRCCLLSGGCIDSTRLDWRCSGYLLGFPKGIVSSEELSRWD